MGNIWDPNHPIHLRWRKGSCFCVVHENWLWDVLFPCLASVEAGASSSASICWTKGCLQSFKCSPLLSHFFMLYIKMLRAGEGRMILTLMGTNSITIPQLFQRRETRLVSVQVLTQNQNSSLVNNHFISRNFSFCLCFLLDFMLVVLDYNLLRLGSVGEHIYSFFFLNNQKHDFRASTKIWVIS